MAIAGSTNSAPRTPMYLKILETRNACTRKATMFAEVITVPDMTPIKARLSNPPAVACGDERISLLRDQVAQNVGPAQCVHEVEDEHHQRDQQQIPDARARA